MRDIRKNRRLKQKDMSTGHEHESLARQMMR